MHTGHFFLLNIQNNAEKFKSVQEKNAHFYLQSIQAVLLWPRAMKAKQIDFWFAVKFGSVLMLLLAALVRFCYAVAEQERRASYYQHVIVRENCLSNSTYYYRLGDDVRGHYWILELDRQEKLFFGSPK